MENVIAGVTVQTPQLDITTVAAGGGSILTYKNGLFNAGPQSAVSTFLVYQKNLSLPRCRVPILVQRVTERAVLLP